MSGSEEPLLKDFPPGPLDEYRKQASFDWKKLKLYFEDEELLRFKVKIIKLNHTIDCQICDVLCPYNKNLT
jgi:hypothetical protein